MKIIIDISEDELTDEEIQDAVECAEDNFSDIVKLSGNFTNRDVIKVMFPDCKYEQAMQGYGYLTFKRNPCSMKVPDVWWNANYNNS